ncbi:MAG: hypothetical protein ACKN9W_11440 [Methylococcus sp.]
MNIIEIDGWDRVEDALIKLSTQRPEWFPNGFKGIHAIANRNLFAGTLGGRLYFSDADTMVAGFRPATALKNALLNIEAGKALVFNEEYAIETLWHEMLHGMSGIQAAKIPIGKDAIEEGLIQSVSRLTYTRLIDQLGGQAAHQHGIVMNGFAYAQTARNFCEMYRRAGIDSDWLLDIVVGSGHTWKPALADALSKGLNIRLDRVQSLYRHASEKKLRSFVEKIALLIRNAPRNNRE